MNRTLVVDGACWLAVSLLIAGCGRTEPFSGVSRGQGDADASGSAPSAVGSGGRARGIGGSGTGATDGIQSGGTAAGGAAHGVGGAFVGGSSTGALANVAGATTASPSAGAGGDRSSSGGAGQGGHAGEAGQAVAGAGAATFAGMHQGGHAGDTNAFAGVSSVAGANQDGGATGSGGDTAVCVQGDLRPCSEGGLLGPCAAGYQVCLGGATWGACSIEPAAADQCIAGDDSDCDGVANEDCACLHGNEQPCGETPNEGICRQGTQSCVEGVWGECRDPVYPGPRDCASTSDNDCDGTPDHREMDCPCPGSRGPTMVRLPEGYCIDATEVTRDQYRAWLDSAPPTSGQPPGCESNRFEPEGVCMDDTGVCQGTECGSHPQVCVSWCDAVGYCKGAGKRLCGRIGGGPSDFDSYADPTHSQWFSACSSHGTNEFPYGDTYESQSCNGSEYSGTNSTTLEVAALPTCQSSGDYAGVFDMSGNVSEWEDSCDGMYCRVRDGGFDGSLSLLFCAAAVYYPLDWGNYSLGFRCCSE